MSTASNYRRILLANVGAKAGHAGTRHKLLQVYQRRSREGQLKGSLLERRTIVAAHALRA